MKTITRNAQNIKSKSKTHEVKWVNEFKWEVVSGTSGKTHIIYEDYYGHIHCDCEWHLYHKCGECSHVAAVRAAKTERPVMLYASEADRKASHYRKDATNDGLFYATRSK